MQASQIKVQGTNPFFRVSKYIRRDLYVKVSIGHRRSEDGGQFGRTEKERRQKLALMHRASLREFQKREFKFGMEYQKQRQKFRAQKSLGRGRKTQNLNESTCVFLSIKVSRVHRFCSNFQRSTHVSRLTIVRNQYRSLRDTRGFPS